jgi:hypothetical protein
LTSWGERSFVAVCALVVLAMIGPVSLEAGVIMATFVGLLMWCMLAALPDEDRDRR